MAAGKTESVTEVKTLVGERGLLVYKSLGKISIPPRRKRETIAQKNLCQKNVGTADTLFVSANETNGTS